mmetsp:Transcript_75849/g.190841  ORF Transcript_75849/g.190841 Transcript_75849/m.190841 type:complete len:226 (-) Transcript_75849:304-981(-)
MRVLKGDQVRVHLPEVRVEGTFEAQARGETRHAERNYVVHLLSFRHLRAHRLLADVPQSSIVKEEALVGVFQQILVGQRSVVGFHRDVAHAGRGHQREGLHDALAAPVQVVPERSQQQACEAGAGASSDGVAELQSLQAIATLGLLADQIEHVVRQVGALRVEGLGVAIARTLVVADNAFGPVEVTQRARSHLSQVLHIEVDKQTPGHVARLPACGGQALVEEDI